MKHNRKIAIDARMWGDHGIGSYLKNLVRNLPDCSGEMDMGLICSAKVSLPSAPAERFAVIKAHSAIYGVSEQLEIAWLARKARVLHCPHYNVPLLYRGRLIVTIHDLIHVTFPAYSATLASRVYARPMMRLAARKACHIIADSEFTKSEIEKFTGVSTSRISVILLGVESRFTPHPQREAFDKVAPAIGVAKPYVLYVSNLRPHKNLKGLLQAMALLRDRKRLDHMLIVVGDDRRWRDATSRLIAELGLSDDVHIIPHVDSELLPWLYAGAEAFVMPSFIEGFGLPVLEAMACGTPVICSRAASLPEVAGDAAIYFDPHNTEELAAAMGKVLGSSELQSEMRRKGLARAKLFSWEECARKHLEIYRQAMQ